MRQLSIYIERRQGREKYKYRQPVGGRRGERKSKTRREQHVLWRSFKSLLCGRSFQASFGQPSCLSGFGLTRGPARRMDFSTRVSGKLTGSAWSGAPPFCDPRGTFLWVCSSRILPDLKNGKQMISFIQAEGSFYLEINCPQGTHYSCTAGTYLSLASKGPCIGHCLLRYVGIIPLVCKLICTHSFVKVRGGGFNIMYLF